MKMETELIMKIIPKIAILLVYIGLMILIYYFGQHTIFWIMFFALGFTMGPLGWLAPIAFIIKKIFLDKK